MVQIWPGTGIGIVKPSPTNKYGYDTSSRKNIKHTAAFYDPQMQP